MDALNPPAPVADIEQRALRDALGCFATGVTVITTLGPDGKPVGFTANSFGSLSLDPPLVLWSMARDATSLPVFERALHFAVNVLTVQQRGLSERFSTPTADKFAAVSWTPGLHGVPILAGALAAFEGTIENRLDGGDHLIFIGAVARFGCYDGAPLLFSQGTYGAAAAHPDGVDN